MAGRADVLPVFYSTPLWFIGGIQFYSKHIKPLLFSVNAFGVTLDLGDIFVVNDFDRKSANSCSLISKTYPTGNNLRKILSGSR